MAEVGYAGSSSHNLLTWVDQNPMVLGTTKPDSEPKPEAAIRHVRVHADLCRLQQCELQRLARQL